MSASGAPAKRALDDAGSIAAEFAVAMPAIVLVLAVCLGAIRLGADQVQLYDAAASAARAVARGDAVPAAVAARSTASTTSEGDLLCVRLERTVSLLRIPVTLSARSCALAGGR